MPSQPPIPHILSPYLAHSTHSAQSLTIITSVLAATPNWLVLRYLHSVLSAATEHNELHQESGSGKKRRRRRAKRVVLVSFMREWLFWRGEGKRLGLDLQRFVEGGRLRFVDGLSGLFDVSKQLPPPQPQQQQQQQGSIRSVPSMGSARSVPMRGPASPRAPLSPPSTSSMAGTPSQAKSSTPQQLQKQLHISGHGIAALNQLENDIQSVIQSLSKSSTSKITDAEEDGDDILLILDQPDLILATTPGVDANDLSDWVMGLQQNVQSTIVTTSADSPLIHNANPYTLTEGFRAATPLERNHASFVVGLAHRADMVLQLRTLDTGAAKDVSGVLRMSRGGGYETESEAVKEDEIAEKEVLYFVQRDGGVRVFGRGEV